MVLPTKSYFSLDEIAKRWGTDLANIKYYAEHGELQVKAWLEDELIVKLYRKKKIENEGEAFVREGITSIQGYVVVDPAGLRIIFRKGSHNIRKFNHPSNHEYYKVYHDKTEVIISNEELVVSCHERDRFEQKYEITVSDEKPQKQIVRNQSPSFGGRPSVMRLIVKQFEDRFQKGETLPSLQKEANFLAAWANENLEATQLPKARTIMNNIRTKYNEYARNQFQTIGLKRQSA